MTERFPDFEVQEFQEPPLKKFTKPKYKESTSTWINFRTRWAEKKIFETDLLAREAKQLDENKTDGVS